MTQPMTQSVSFKKLQKRLRRQTGQAVMDFQMIEQGDHIMVCLSGGKDSYTLLDNLIYLQKVAPIEFRLTAVNLDQKQPGFPADVLPTYLQSIGVDYHIVTEDTYSIVKEKIPVGKTTCSLCSRLRRGILYNTAKSLGATKIALGHHRDDMIETLFLNMFHGGRMKAMPPKLHSDNGEHIVIRPLAYCAEKDIEKYALAMAYPIIPCNLCGSQENLQRKQIKMLLQDWQTRFPGRIENIFRAMQHITPSHLADRELYDFINISHQHADGDVVFDQQAEFRDAVPNSDYTEDNETIAIQVK